MRSPGTTSITWSAPHDAARKIPVTSIAFPSISTGVYGYPVDRAARIAVDTVRGCVEESGHALRRVVFCCFSDGDLAVYRDLLASPGGPIRDAARDG